VCAERLVAGLSPRRPGFISKLDHVGFLVARVVLGQVPPHPFRLLEIFLVVIVPEMLQAQSFVHDRRLIAKQMKASLRNTLKIAGSYKL
jgi:hypothetical protein